MQEANRTERCILSVLKIGRGFSSESYSPGTVARVANLLYGIKMNEKKAEKCLFQLWQRGGIYRLPTYPERLWLGCSYQLSSELEKRTEIEPFVEQQKEQREAQ